MNQMNIASVDLNLLKAFEALHDESSASRAALRLGVTQSAMSAALRRLRELYGDPLFVRTGRGLAPTLKANQLKPVVSEALNKCRQSLAMVAPDTADYQGRSVTLGLSDDFEIAYGRQMIEAVARRAPKLRLIFRQSHSQIVAEALLQRSVDLAISAGGFAERLLSRQVLGKAITCAWQTRPAWPPGNSRSVLRSLSHGNTCWCRPRGLSGLPMKAWPTWG
ncbi:hypothetical protein PEQA60_30740 [Pseudomonas sp. Eqa60]|nr:hypothetical protein PEQA60_30740 [Pseudomonas sp. Eqa60]